jgi:hypothetical protein
VFSLHDFPVGDQDSDPYRAVKINQPILPDLVRRKIRRFSLHQLFIDRPLLQQRMLFLYDDWEFDLLSQYNSGVDDEDIR